MQVKVDRQRCVGAGMCVLNAPEVFDQSDGDGRVILVTRRVRPADVEAVARAAAACPSRAISVEGLPRGDGGP